MEIGRVATSYKSMFMAIMLVLGMMVGTSDASFQQCLVRCLRTCVFNIDCTVRCGVNCYISDPPFGAHPALSKGNYNNMKFCNLGCLATALGNNPSSALEVISEREAEEKAEQMVDGCSSACSYKNFKLH